MPTSGTTTQALLDAVAAALPGDVVLVEPGDYEVALAVPAGVTLRGTAGPASTTLHTGGDTVVTALEGSGGETVFEGLTIVGDWTTDPYGLRLGPRTVQAYHDLAVVDCVLSGGATTGDGASVRVNGPYRVRIERSVLQDANAWVNGGHVALGAGAALELVDSTLLGGLAFADGGAVHAVGATVTVERSVLSGGIALGAGGGLYLQDTSAELVDTVVSGAYGVTGGGLHASGGSLSLSRVVLAGNLADTGGGARVTGLDTFEVLDSLLSGNVANAGAGLHVESCCVGAPFVVERTRVCANHGGGLHADDSRGAVRNSLFLAGFGLTSLTPAGAVAAEGTSQLTLDNDVLAWGTGDEAGAIVAEAEATVDLRNMLVAWNTTGPAVRDVTVTHGAFWANTLPHAEPVELLDATSQVDLDPRIPGAAIDACTLAAWWPEAGSPLVDAGDPAIRDPDGSVSDIGLWGGPGAPDTDGDGARDVEDCAPDDATVHPGAPEVCDGIDDDCDGAVDALDPDVQGLVTLAPDADGDGYAADDAVFAAVCPGAPGAASAGDCDDADPDTFPGAPEDGGPDDRACDGTAEGRLRRDCGCAGGGSALLALPLIVRRRRRGPRSPTSS